MKYLLTSGLSAIHSLTKERKEKQTAYILPTFPLTKRWQKHALWNVSHQVRDLGPMSAEINRDSNAPANGCAADACNAQPSSRQRLRPVTSPQPSFSSYRTESISPGMQRPGITHEPANRVPTLSPHSQGPELKSGTVTGDGQLISAGLHAIELTNKVSKHCEIIMNPPCVSLL